MSRVASTHAAGEPLPDPGDESWLVHLQGAGGLTWTSRVNPEAYIIVRELWEVPP